MTDTFSLNLDNVEAWKAGGMILAPGTHPVKVVDEEIDTSGDHPVVKLQMEAIGGDEQGGEIRDWIHVTAKAMGKVAQIYEAFKVEIPAGDFNWIPLKGRQAKIVVRREPKRSEPDKEVSVVRGYTALADADRVGAAVEQSLDAKPADHDDDIPF